MQKSEKVELLSLIILLGFFAAVTYHYIAMIYFAARYPANTFLFLGTPFNDFYISLIQVANFTPYDMGQLTAQYFPLSYLLIYPFVWIHGYLALAIYLTSFVFCGVAYVYYFCKLPVTRMSGRLNNIKNTFIIFFLSYPFLFSFERANLEMLLVIFFALAFYMYEHKRWLLSSLLLGMAGAMKLYPLFMSVYYLADKRYSSAAYAFVFALIIIVGCLAIFPPGLAINVVNWKAALSNMGDYIIYEPEIAKNYNIGLWGIIKSISINSSHNGHHALLHKFELFHFFALVYLMLVSAYVIFIEKMAWRRLFLIVSAILLLPEMSNDYKMLFLYIPLVYFINAPANRADWFYLLGFALLMIPKNYYFIFPGASISPFINVVIMLAMVIAIMTRGTYDKYSVLNLEMEKACLRN